MKQLNGNLTEYSNDVAVNSKQSMHIEDRTLEGVFTGLHRLAQWRLSVPGAATRFCSWPSCCRSGCLPYSFCSCILVKAVSGTQLSVDQPHYYHHVRNLTEATGSE